MSKNRADQTGPETSECCPTFDSSSCQDSPFCSAKPLVERVTIKLRRDSLYNGKNSDPKRGSSWKPREAPMVLISATIETTYLHGLPQAVSNLINKLGSFARHDMIQNITWARFWTYAADDTHSFRGREHSHPPSKFTVRPPNRLYFHKTLKDVEFHLCVVH